MKLLYYDCFSGISGDMNLSAMIDLGVPSSHLSAELKKLNLSGYELVVSEQIKKGITGTKVEVKITKHEHVHIHLKDIEKILCSSSLNDEIKKAGLKMFTKIAEAEAKIHGKKINEVHFHEVGAVDSIVDIVGAAICFDYLEPDKIFCGPVEVGSGLVKCAHGNFPVPAPATAEILKGIPITTGNQNFEATTPTGATILACNVNEFVSSNSMTITKTAYGIGHKDAEIPNVLRVFWSEDTEKKSKHSIIECNIDDMNPELIGFVMDKLFEKGADDVFITPIIMKKSRNGSKLSVLCCNDLKANLIDLLLKETSTFGVRCFSVDKTELKRDFIVIETKYGKVKVKRAFIGDEVLKEKPEYEDCVKLSKKHNIPISEIYKAVNNRL